MPRARGGYKTRRRRKKIIALAKGFRGRAKSVYNIARPMVERALCFAYRDRRRKKRDFRRLWIIRISAACKANSTSYSKFMGRLKKHSIELNRKSLSELAIHSPESFTELVKSTAG